MKKYSKLETIGEWSSIDLETTKQVNISFGSISLNIADATNEPISQWTYASVSLVEMNIESAVFSPDEEETERLKIFDKDAVKYLLSLSEKKIQKPIKRTLRPALLLFLVCIFTLLIFKYHRPSLEKIALTITSQEQENFIGSLIITNQTAHSFCNSESVNSFLNALITKEMGSNETIIKVSFLSSFSKYSLLLPGGTLLIPENILTDDNGLKLFETLILNSLKSQKELRPIKVFFSNQKTLALVYYIIGYFESLNFNRHLKFKLENLNWKLEKKFNIDDKQWMKLRALCT